MISFRGWPDKMTSDFDSRLADPLRRQQDRRLRHGVQVEVLALPIYRAVVKN